MRINPKISQKIMVIVLAMATAVTVFILFYIIIFMLGKGIPVLSWQFLSRFPEKMGKAGGILPTIVGTFALTLLAIIIATPLGVGASLYLTEYTREGKVTKLVRFGAECLAGVPSIIFGLFGFILFVVIMKMGWSILSGGLTLAVMILPTIIRTSEEAIKAVPSSYREVSFSLGATKWETIKKIVLPGALPGILTGIILGVGRSIGETAAVIFTAGSSLRLPSSLFDSVRTMSVHFYILAREGISLENAYGTAAILIVLIMAINILTYGIMHKVIKNRA